MTNYIEISIRCWHQSGLEIRPDMLQELLKVPVSDNCKLHGTGQRWQAARMEFVALSIASCSQEAEPSEAFQNRLDMLLSKMGTTLQSIESEAILNLREDGYNVDLFIDSSIDQNQCDIVLGHNVIAELSRLGLSLVINTNGE